MSENFAKQKVEEKVDKIFEDTKLKKEKELELERQKEENQKELGSN